MDREEGDDHSSGVEKLFKQGQSRCGLLSSMSTMAVKEKPSYYSTGGCSLAGSMGKSSVMSVNGKASSPLKNGKSEQNSLTSSRRSSSNKTSRRISARSLNRRRHHTPSPPHKKCKSCLAKSSSSTVNSRLKFSLDVTHPLADANSDTEDLSTDETVRLFQVMPKGLQRFLSLGPPKMCKDQIDYLTMTEQHKRLIAELRMQLSNNTPRASSLQEGQEQLLEDIIFFNEYFVERKKLIHKDRACFVKNLNERYRMAANITQAQAEMEKLVEKRDILLKRVEKLNSLKQFERKLFIQTPFKSMEDLMQKHASLKDNLKTQIRQVFIGQGHLEQLRCLHKDYISGVNMKHIHMKMEIQQLDAIQKQKEIENNEIAERVTRSNRNKHDPVICSAVETIRMSVANMAHQLLVYRPFTRRRLQDAKTIPEKLAAIGKIISDYNEILVESEESIDFGKSGSFHGVHRMSNPNPQKLSIVDALIS